MRRPSSPAALVPSFLILLPTLLLLLCGRSHAFLCPSPSSHRRDHHSLYAAATGANVFYSPVFLEHKTRGYHPENPLRVSVPAQLLSFIEGIHIQAPTTTPTQALAAVLKIHEPAYVQEIQALSLRGGGALDADTYTNAATYDVCLLATAAWMDSARATLGGGAGGDSRRPSFALTRPPGHHALRGQGMGFCVFNFAVVAARYALDELGCKKVAILDWDAHHGNGNEALIRDQAQMCYASFHQTDAFPMTGLDPADHGALGNILDVPVPAYSDIKTYLPLLEDKVLPFLQAFGPDLVIVSAGYDSLADDPLAQLALGPGDFKTIVERLKDVFGAEKLMFGLEGGYEPEAVAAAIASTLKPFL